MERVSARDLQKLEIAVADGLAIWLNRRGDGLLWGETDRIMLRGGLFAMVGGGICASWTCTRKEGDAELDVIVLRREWLVSRLGQFREGLDASLESWLASCGRVSLCGLMTSVDHGLCAALDEARNRQTGAQLGLEAKLLEWVSERFYSRPGRTFPHGGATAHSDFVKRALVWLSAHADQPLNLPALAKDIGVSPFHLSRKVKMETGETLQKHLRRIRIDRAVALMRTSTMNVTEIALDVGYQSLSHFAKAFREETGKTPKAWMRER